MIFLALKSYFSNLNIAKKQGLFIRVSTMSLLVVMHTKILNGVILYVSSIGKFHLAFFYYVSRV